MSLAEEHALLQAAKGLPEPFTLAQVREAAGLDPETARGPLAALSLQSRFVWLPGSVYRLATDVEVQGAQKPIDAVRLAVSKGKPGESRSVYDTCRCSCGCTRDLGTRDEMRGGLCAACFMDIGIRGRDQHKARASR